MKKPRTHDHDFKLVDKGVVGMYRKGKREPFLGTVRIAEITQGGKDGN